MRFRGYVDYSYWSLPFRVYYKCGILGFSFLCWHGYVVTVKNDPWPEPRGKK
jgi:hypothetical protein